MRKGYFVCVAISHNRPVKIATVNRGLDFTVKSLKGSVCVCAINQILNSLLHTQSHVHPPVHVYRKLDDILDSQTDAKITFR